MQHKIVFLISSLIGKYKQKIPSKPWGMGKIWKWWRDIKSRMLVSNMFWNHFVFTRTWITQDDSSFQAQHGFCTDSVSSSLGLEFQKVCHNNSNSNWKKQKRKTRISKFFNSKLIFQYEQWCYTERVSTGIYQNIKWCSLSVWTC